MTSVRTRQHGPTLHVVLSRPEARNALDVPTLRALRAHVQEAGADPGVRAIVLEAEGPTFSAGGDIRTMAASAGRPLEVHARLRDGLVPLVRTIHHVPKPVLAMVHGDAHGAGAILAFQCDLTLVARGARFTLAFRNVGLVPDTGGTWLLPRTLGMQRAKMLAWTGRAFSGEEAVAWGLALSAHAPDELRAAVEGLAAELAAGPRTAIGLQKAAFHRHAGATLDAALEGEARLQALASTSAEHAEGRDAFLQKRKPDFTVL
ncbi:MAG TPA: enoyl-CoA hydratase-related protein [Candidatus Thermoplasmatota archaeon]|nr:enoyl-CoA hydratase-related protein [Candidatus Thermoplasmatota archaeon]